MFFLRVCAGETSMPGEKSAMLSLNFEISTISPAGIERTYKTLYAPAINFKNSLDDAKKSTKYSGATLPAKLTNA